MDPDPWLAGAAVVGLLLLVSITILSALETAVISARRSRLAQIRSPRRVAAAEKVLDSPDHFQASAHLAKSLCEAIFYAIAALGGLQAILATAPPPFPDSLNDLLRVAWPGAAAGAVAGYFAITLFGEWLPKSWASRSPESLLLRAAGFIQGFTLLFTPIRRISSALARLLALSTGLDPSLASRAAHSEEEIKLLVEGSAEEGVLEEDEKEMIHSVIEFTDTVARQVMVPRIDIHSVSVDAPLAEVVNEVLESGHSRLPVYEGTLDRVVGIVHIKDLLPHLVRGDRQVSIRPLLREPFFVPEGKKLDELLQEFRTYRSQLAVVVDEFGGTSGLVSIEDVVEEIVGEIEDEYDEAQPLGPEFSAGEGTGVDARMTIDDINELLNLELPRGDYDTLGGFVFSLFGRPPAVGEQVTFQGLRLIMEAVDGLRIQRIRIIPEGSQEEAAELAGAEAAADREVSNGGRAQE